MFGLLASGCAVTEFQSAEEGVTVRRTFLSGPKNLEDETEVFLFKPKGAGPFPGVVMIHGDQPDPTGRLGVREYFIDNTGEFLASRGYAVMAPSMPGFGASTGKADFVGPETIGRLAFAIQYFQKLPYVDGERIAIFGDSRGATAAALLARKVPRVRGLILQSGVYDLTEVMPGEDRDTPLSREQLELRKKIEREAGLNERDMKLRSPLLFSDELTCPIVFIHGTADQVVPISQMREFVKRLRKEMGKEREVTSREVPTGHFISGAMTWSEALPFLERCFGKTGLAHHKDREKKDEVKE